MTKCHREVVTQGYVESPWGRRRYFPKKPEEWMVAANQREGGNFPIQSTIADTMRLAMSRVMRQRTEEGLQFKVVNQIHDALILMTPTTEREQAKKALITGMSGIKIPMPSGVSLELGVDIDEYSRWGEKLK
jgi:DNA polymerase I-like protein with 3'-5' exonuclease and polymerase domains